MKPYDQVVAEDRRLVILRILAKSDGYTCNEYLLRQILDTQGHAVSKDRLRTDLGWLQEQGLIHVSVAGETHIAKINDRGIDVSKGLVQFTGVKRPSAGD